jgi:hypothetical protein
MDSLTVSDIFSLLAILVIFFNFFTYCLIFFEAIQQHVNLVKEITYIVTGQ